ncbi:hypothetical protein ACFFWA_28900 [Actinomadura verrucosospora]|uniref:hypothetical protein n=1 Tax=Actinomadura verrucosospora TaxID=46165 RepID=UPI0031EDA200
MQLRVDLVTEYGGLTCQMTSIKSTASLDPGRPAVSGSRSISPSADAAPPTGIRDGWVAAMRCSTAYSAAAIVPRASRPASRTSSCSRSTSAASGATTGRTGPYRSSTSASGRTCRVWPCCLR